MARLTIYPEFEHLFTAREARSFDAIWNLKSEKIFSENRTSDVHVVALHGDGGEGDRAPERLGVLKRYWYPHLSDRLKGFFRNTFFGMCRAAREFRSLSRLRRLDCTIVRPIAVGEDRSLRLLKRAFIVTEFIPGTRSLAEILESPAFREWPTLRRRRLAADLGCWVRSLHDRRFHDRDLFARNILVHESPSGSGQPGLLTYRFLFSKIDSSAASGGLAEPGTGRPYLRDLSDLDRDVGKGASRQDRLRFLLAYLATDSLGNELRTLMAHLG